MALKLRYTPLAKYALGRAFIDLMLFPSDLCKIRASYFQAFKRYPRLCRPRTFNEHIQARKLFARQNEHAIYADKFAVRQYVADTIGSNYLTRLIWQGSDLTDVPISLLPNKFVVKATNGSGTNILVQNLASFDWQMACQTTQRWLESDHSRYYGEWQYRWIPPRLIIEEFLDGGPHTPPFDYKFFCFSGKAAFVQVDVNRFSNRTRAFYTPGFERLPFSLQYKQHFGHLDRPECFDDMLHAAQLLAGYEPFVRVDFYDVGRPVFGELTLHPGAGHELFDPPEWDYYVGSLFHCIN